MGNKITVALNTVSVNNNIITGDATGIYIFGGYQKNDSNSDGLLDSVNFEPLEAYGVSKVIDDVELNQWHYELTKLSSEDVADYMPEISQGSLSESTGAVSPELLAIEQEKLALEKERREEEKIAHKNLHSEEIVTTTDILGNEETHVKGHYPSLRSHKYYENSESQWGLNQVEIVRHEFKASQYEKVMEKVGIIPFSDITFDTKAEFEKIVSEIDFELSEMKPSFSISADAVLRSQGKLPLND
jgi:hypothetical protein